MDTFHLTPEIVFGPGALARLPEHAQKLKASMALIVSDPGIASQGYPQRAAKLLQEHGIASCLFTEVEENPSSATVSQAKEYAKTKGIDLIIGLGGGSSLDCAKGVNFLLSNGGEMEDYHGYHKATRPMLPSIGIPTTTGTGSEMQSYALITSSRNQQKMACGDPKAAFRAAILDPELTLTQPAGVTIATGWDAITHAIETAVCRVRTPFSQIFSQHAWELASRSFLANLQQPESLTQHSNMLLAAGYAGIAIENSMLGIAHSCANPLTKNHNLIHGLAVAFMLPSVVRYNDKLEEASHIYQKLCQQAGWQIQGTGGETLATKLESWLIETGVNNQIHLKLQGLDLEKLAHEASEQWTARFNPRPVTKKDCYELYQTACSRLAS